MKSQRKFFSQEDRPIFTDLHDQSKLFTMELDEFERQNKIVVEYGGQDSSIPHDITVKVHSIKRADNMKEMFEIIADTQIEFPIYRILWLK